MSSIASQSHLLSHRHSGIHGLRGGYRIQEENKESQQCASGNIPLPLPPLLHNILLVLINICFSNSINSMSIKLCHWYSSSSHHSNRGNI